MSLCYNIVFNKRPFKMYYITYKGLFKRLHLFFKTMVLGIINSRITSIYSAGHTSKIVLEKTAEGYVYLVIIYLSAA